jgi:dipeptidase D
MTFVSELEPKELWQHFDRILTIPRGSKNEKQMADYVKVVAERNGLSYRQDDAGNVVVEKPGVAGHEKAASTILQAHLDMVNEKNADVNHDFEKDPITPRKEGGYLYATGTTLGSDNGIGVAASLALMENKTVQHGPLEFLFTVDEETGLTGATNLANDILHGKALLNMDTEEEGALYVGCAGGQAVNITLPLEYEDVPNGFAALDIKLSGLKGGHSGVDIHLQRGNAIKLLARALLAVNREKDFQLAGIRGGNMHNAIPREAFAIAVMRESNLGEFNQALKREISLIQAEFKPAEPDMKLSADKAANQPKIFDHDCSSKTLNLLNALPHGVLAMSYDIPDLVETSSNLATVRTEKDELRIHVSNRSSVDSAIRAVQQRVGSIGHLAGAVVEQVEGYPGWKPNLDSHVLQVAKDAHKVILGKQAEVKAVHAGLECGIIGEKYPGMDMVSFGPQIEFPHSPDERVKIASVADFWKLLIGILERLA